MGKFLEDIGLLAGRYPYIRTDYIQDDDWFDPAIKTGNQNRYNNYEKCILTFKPLPTSKDDSKLPTDQMLDNTEISKGFSHESYTVDDIEIVKINFQDKTNIQYSRLTASQRKDKLTGNVQTFTFSDNIFVSYLVDKSDDEEIKKKLENYKALKLKIFGKENKKGNMSSTALFAQGYYNMKYRSYVPYELTTYADPVRDVGDRIKITYTDVVTGEHVSFFSYILEREMNGIQKCLDTYKAQGDGLNPVFSNYKTGSTYQSGSSYAASSFGYNAVYSGTGTGGSSGSGALGVTPSNLVQYWRNFGIRLLDEPDDCEAKFVKGSESSNTYTYNQLAYQCLNYDSGITRLYDGDTTNPINIWDSDNEQPISVTAKENDYVSNSADYENVNEYYDTTHNCGAYSSMYIYDANKWLYTGPNNVLNDSSTIGNLQNMIKNIDDFYEGSTQTEIQLRRRVYYDDTSLEYSEINKYSVDTVHAAYGTWFDSFFVYTDYYAESALSEEITIEAKYGTIIYGLEDYFTYIYPGVWVEGDYTSSYPENSEVDITTKKYVSLKWSDPQDITDWKPTPATWEGTVIVRKENSAPLHRWDGEKVVRTTTRDKYKTKAYKDEDIKANKVYYYGFFPYYTKISDPDHPIRFYTFTKTIRVETGVITYAPVIESITVDGNNATITYAIIAPADIIYTSIKLYGRIGEYPKCDDTDDICEDILQSETEYVVGDLSYDTEYYFVIQCVDINEAETNSNVESCILYDPVPPELKPYISTMNDIAAYKFFFANIPASYYTGYPLYRTLQFQYPATNYSYSRNIYSSSNVLTFSEGFSDNGKRMYTMRTYNILTLNVTKNSETNYTGRINFGAGAISSIHNIYNPKNYNSSWFSIGVSSVESGSINFWNSGNTGDGDTTVDYVSYSGTLAQVFAWFADRFRNIDIFVDGVQYAKSHYSN